MKTETTLGYLSKAILIACFVSSTVYAADVKHSALSTKTTPVTGDKALIIDSADGNKSKNVTLGSLPVSTPTQIALDLKAVKPYVNTSAPADTTLDWYDTDQEVGVYVHKKHNGTTWVRVGSHGVQYLSSCASITAGMCVDTDDGKLYYHNGTAVVEVGTGGSGATYTAGTGIDINGGVISSTVTGTLPSATEGQGVQKGATAWEAVDLAPLTFVGSNISYNSETGLATVPVTGTATSGSAVPFTSGGAYTALGGKQDALVSGTSIKTVNNTSLLGSGNIDIAGGTGGYVTLSAVPYSDVDCTTGQYGYYGSTAYLCTGGFWTSKWALTTHSNASPVTYNLTITPSGFTGADKFTYNSTDYTTEHVISGLSADASFTVTPDTGREIACTGTGLTDNTGGSYTANTDTANVVATCTSSATVATYSESFDGTDGTLLSTFSNWSSINATFVETNFKISGNAITPTAAYAKAGGFHSLSTSDISQIIFKGQTSTDISRFLAVRANTDSTGYSIQLGYPSATDWRQISFFKNGTSIGTAQTISPTVPYGVDHTFKLVATGSSPVTLSVYIDGSGTAAATMTDSTSPITSGHPGFYINTGSSTGNAFFDNWQDY